eukprot:3274525-Amphidinium_carterae.1
MKVTDLRFSKGQVTDHFKHGKQTGLPVSSLTKDILDAQRRLDVQEHLRVVAVMYHGTCVVSPNTRECAIKCLCNFHAKTSQQRL